jgi:hypothetical protein
MRDPAAGFGDDQALMRTCMTNPTGLKSMNDLIVVRLRIRSPKRQKELTTTGSSAMAGPGIAAMLGQKRQNIELERRDFLLSEYLSRQDQVQQRR